MKLQLLIKKIFGKLTPPEYLLYLLLFHKGYFMSGLCGFILKLWIEGIISEENYDILIEWIKNNKPEGISYYSFWFQYGELKPRIDYLKTFTPLGGFRGKSEPELLLYLLREYPEYFDDCLCIFVSKLKHEDILNKKTQDKLHRWINRNSPDTYSLFWFKPGDLKSRIEHLKTFL